eukprot:gene14330-14456_t
MVHSIYSERDVFLRELISNAADACEKLRYDAVQNPGLLDDSNAFAITITADDAQHQLTIADNGIGMDENDLVNALGTIARSGTKSFLEQLEAGATNGEKSNVDLIGQFGIGFYSAFIVAEKVVVETRRVGSSEAFRWTSDGKGTYEITPLALENAPAHGTRVVLHLNAESHEFAQSYRLRSIITQHSNAISVPVDLVEALGAEAERVSNGTALWTKPKSEIEPKDYQDFYNNLSGQFDEPALTIHWRAEGRYEYNVLAFVPGSRPFDLFEPERKGKGKLYVRRVLINDNADLLPGWLRFVRLVVDSADIPLNVSREMIQQSPIYAAIKKGVTNRIVQELTKCAENEPTKFAKIWEDFGAVLKEGLYEDPTKRDELFKLVRFASTKSETATRALSDYITDLRPNQTAIYYLLGDDLKRLGNSPQLEGFAARGIEVLLLPDPVDAFWVMNALGFEGKPFKSVSQGAADLGLIPLLDGSEAPKAAEATGEIASLLVFMKDKLSEYVADVRASDRLSSSVACLVATEDARDRRLERILSQHGQLPEMSKPVLEINIAHDLVKHLAHHLNEADKSLVEDGALLILDQAKVLDGEPPTDAAGFAARLGRLLTKALS